MTERGLAKNAARRLAIICHAEEVTDNVAKSCRYYDIRRPIYSTLLHRYEEEGLAGLRSFLAPETEPQRNQGRRDKE